jgi:hypothetical protein
MVLKVNCLCRTQYVALFFVYSFRHNELEFKQVQEVLEIDMARGNSLDS